MEVEKQLIVADHIITTLARQFFILRKALRIHRNSGGHFDDAIELNTLLTNIFSAWKNASTLRDQLKEQLPREL
jgi:hypothetical protein